MTLFILTVKAYPELMPNRVDTWTNRIENFINSENTESNYQIEKAKIAIATGGIKGLGPGKSIQKNFMMLKSKNYIKLLDGTTNLKSTLVKHKLLSGLEFTTFLTSHTLIMRNTSLWLALNVKLVTDQLKKWR